MTSGATEGARLATTAEVLALVEAAMRGPIEGVAPAGPGADDLRAFYGLMRYHLGWADAEFAPIDGTKGKRLRPLLLVRCAEACGGTVAAAVPAAAAIEQLHNFTLVHDDIQDESAYRHHRETIWHRWGTATAINAGDALFAVAHEALYRLAEPPANVPAGRVLALARDFDRMALRIVEGQHLDLSHEGEWGGGEARYLAMIAGKTAAIMDFAARAGATVAGADDETADRFGAFGLALGLAFQIRDDMLGIWGMQEATGKPVADDIRRRKQSLPIIALDERADAVARAELRRLYAGAAPLDEDAVARVAALLERYEIADYCQSRVDAYHHAARGALDHPAMRGTAADSLHDFLALLEGRVY
jgi:geranylgeranyl diphosphate synthase type I